MKRNFLTAIFIISLASALLAPPAGAQSQSLRKKGGKDTPSEKADSSAKPPRKGSAWTLATPLGQRKKSTIDTLQYNYQRHMIASFQSDAYATTGTIGGPGTNMIFFDRPNTSTFFFDDALGNAVPTQKTVKFYNVYTPMTLLSYNYGGNKLNHLDRLNGVFAGNVNRNIGIGALIDYTYSKGSYTRQGVKNFSYGFTAYYNTHRYEGQAEFYHFYHLNQENGGITDMLYITDPAAVQGGLDKIEAKSIPTRLSTAVNRLEGNHLFTTHAFKMGYWTEEVVNDTLTRDLYIPVTKIVYSLDFDNRRHNFKNSRTREAQDFWGKSYFDPTFTDDDTRYWTVTNTLGVQLLEGFRKWARFGISAYASLQTRRITQTTHAMQHRELSEQDIAMLTPMPDNLKIPSQLTQNRLSAGGKIDKTQGEAITYSAAAKFGITGGIAGDVNLDGTVASRFKMLGDTVAVSAYGGFANVSNSYFLNKYISNHFIWSQSLGKSREVKFGGELTIPWTRTKIKAGLRNLQNYVFFNEASMPEQFGGNVQVFSATLFQHLKAGIWNWKNTLTYQTSSNQRVIPLPALAVYSDMYLEFTAFKVLHLMLGIDCDYYTRYWAPSYQPATMTFHTQREMKIGNYPFCNLYVSAKLSKARFYVLWSHFNQGLFGGSGYFSMPYYPLNPRTLQLGISVDFAN